jgi:tetratricopeptide (TPR) repeat protein
MLSVSQAIDKTDTKPSELELSKTDLESQPEEGTDWEERESAQLYNVAKQHHQHGDLQAAIKDYSEILEFFPNTTSWQIACIELCNIYLETNNTKACQGILERLSHKRTDGDGMPPLMLMAHWDFFVESKDIAQLKSWLQQRKQSELKSLRINDAWKARFKKLLRQNNFSHQQLIDVWWLMGHPSPLDALLQMAEASQGLLLSKSLCLTLLSRTLLGEQAQALERTLNLMGVNGWAKSVKVGLHNHLDTHGITLTKLKWKSTWLRFCIKHHLYGEAQDLLNTLDPQQHLSERFICATHLNHLNEAANLLIDSPPWLKTALPYEEMLTLCRRLGKEPFLKPLLPKCLEVLKPQLRDIIEADLTSPGPHRKQRLNKIITEGDLYGPRAALVLGKELGRERDHQALGDLIKKVEQHYPTAIETINQLEQLSKTLNTLQEDNS